MGEQKDWTGNSHSVFKQLGSSHHAKDGEREPNDYYATDPRAVEWLLQLENFDSNIWEPACGEGHIAKVLIDAGHNVLSTDLIDRGFGDKQLNFIAKTNKDVFDGDIITNPPYKYATEFIVKALELLPEGKKVAMFLRVQFMEGKGRKSLFEIHPPKTIYVSSSRLNCAKNGDFAALRNTGGSPIAYAWYVWEKGYKGDTVLKWFN